jgi:hypothetical protein
MKPVVTEKDLEQVRELDITSVGHRDRIEIVIDDDAPDQVEIYMLDLIGHRVEGGTFRRAAFMDHILEFYRREF